MLNRIVSLFIQEPKIIFKIIIIIAIAFASIFLWKKQELLYAQLRKIEDEKQLVSEIGESETRVQSPNDSKKAGAEEALKEKQKKDFILKGIFLSDNAYHALIGNDFYKEGDICGNYVIKKIDLDYIIVEDKNTKHVQVITLSE